MTTAEFPEIVWAWTLVQVLGLAAALATRLNLGGRSQAVLQAAFLGLLGLVGATAMISFRLNTAAGLICGTTLAVMAIAVICDFRGLRSPA